MRAAVLVAPGKLEVQEVPDLEIGPGEVLVDPSTIGFGSTLVTLPAVGEAQHSVPLPANPALVGVLLVSQGVVVDLAAPHHLLLTNALDLQIGW